MSLTLGLVATKITAETLVKAAIDKAALHMVNKSLAASENEAASLAGRLVNAAAMKTDDFTSVPTNMQGFQNKALTPGIQSEIKEFAENLTKINSSLSAKQATAIAHYGAMVILQEAAAHSGNEVASTATFAVLHGLNESFKLRASAEKGSFSPKHLEKRNILSDRCEKLMTPSVNNKGLNNLSFGNRFTDRIVKPIINTPAFMVAGSKLIQQLTHKFSQFVDQNFTIKNIWPFEKDKTISVGGGLDHTERLIQDTSQACKEIRQAIKDIRAEQDARFIQEPPKVIFDQKHEKVFLETPKGGVNRGILFYGGSSALENYGYYYEDLCKQYKELRKYVAPENIYILYADGQNPAKDTNLNNDVKNPYCVNSDMSLFEGSKVFAATPENYKKVMEEIQKDSTENDHLLVHSFDHGAEDGSIVAWGKHIKPRDFAEPIEACKGKRTILMHQCHSGGLARAFKTNEDIFVSASASPYQPTWGNFAPKAQLAALEHHGSFMVKTHDFFSTAVRMKSKLFEGQKAKLENGQYIDLTLAVETPEAYGGNFHILASPQTQIGIKPLPQDWGPSISVYA